MINLFKLIKTHGAWITALVMGLLIGYGSGGLVGSTKLIACVSELSNVKNTLADHTIAAQMALLDQQAENAKQRRIIDEQMDELARAHQENLRLNTTTDKLRTTTDKLRDEISRLRRAADDHTSESSAGSATTNAVSVLAGLLDQCAVEYGTMAKVADDAHARGLNCQRAYQIVKENVR